MPIFLEVEDLVATLLILSLTLSDLVKRYSDILMNFFLNKIPFLNYSYIGKLVIIRSILQERFAPRGKHETWLEDA